MKKEYPLVSVLIATYNSERVLERTLSALGHQTYPRDALEIIVVDGGSSDHTRQIARKYDCTILDNPQKDPNNAKKIGFRSVKGDYLMVLDHDEVLQNRNSILDRVDALQKYSSCKVAFCSGYKRPDNYPGINEYISEYGDPFSFFYYHCSKSYRFYSKVLKSKSSHIIEDEKCYCYTLSSQYNELLIELACMATIIDVHYFQERFDFIYHQDIIDYMFYMMMEKGQKDVIIMKDDPLLHYSVDAISSYLPKLRWRIINNIYLQKENPYAFAGRKKHAAAHSIKEYLFPIYSISFIIPFIESIYHSITRKNIAYFWHPVLCYYVTFSIMCHLARKVLHMPAKQRTYNGEKK